MATPTVSGSPKWRGKNMATLHNLCAIFGISMKLGTC